MISKRKIINKVLHKAGFNTVTSETTSTEFDKALQLLEDTMIAMSANQGYRLGYIKADTDEDYIDPDVDSGLQDHMVLYVADIITMKLLEEYDMPVSAAKMKASREAMTRLLPEIDDSLRVSSKNSIPCGSGKNRGYYSPRYINQKLDDDDIELIKGGVLDLE